MALSNMTTIQHKTWFTRSNSVTFQSVTFASGEVLAARVVVARVKATGKAVAWDPNVVDGSQTVIGLTAQSVDASASDKTTSIYKSGAFNIDLVIWPDGVTEAQKQGCFDGTNINVEQPNEG